MEATVLTNNRTCSCGRTLDLSNPGEVAVGACARCIGGEALVRVEVESEHMTGPSCACGRTLRRSVDVLLGVCSACYQHRDPRPVLDDAARERLRCAAMDLVLFGLNVARAASVAPDEHVAAVLDHVESMVAGTTVHGAQPKNGKSPAVEAGYKIALFVREVARMHLDPSLSERDQMRVRIKAVQEYGDAQIAGLRLGAEQVVRALRAAADAKSERHKSLTVMLEDAGLIHSRRAGRPVSPEAFRVELRKWTDSPAGENCIRYLPYWAKVFAYTAAGGPSPDLSWMSRADVA